MYVLTNVMLKLAVEEKESSAGCHTTGGRGGIGTPPPSSP